MNKHAVVIGGGISGLAAAYHLSKKKISKVTVLESAGRFGGILRTLRADTFYMEAGADAFDGREAAILDLCAELGLKSELIECEPTLQKIFFSGGRNIFPVDLSDPLKIFFSPVLSLRSRTRLLFEIMAPARKEKADESIAAFVRRRFGKNILKELVDPLIRSVLMGEVEKLSLEKYFSQWRAMDLEYGGMTQAVLKGKIKTLKPMPFFTLRGGLDQLPGALVKKLSETVLELRTEVTAVRHEGDWKIFLKNNRTIRADAVCLALPACAAAKLLLDFAPSLAGELAKIRYDPVLAVDIVFPNETFPAKFPKSGFVVPLHGQKWPFASLKLIRETTNSDLIRARAFFSGAFQPEAFIRNDEALKNEVLQKLAEEWNIRTAPLWISVERYPEGLPQYEVGHQQLVSGIEHKLQSYPGLFITGNGYRGFGISDCVREARRVATAMETFQKLF